jgi:hypothetical protein
MLETVGGWEWLCLFLNGIEIIETMEILEKDWFYFYFSLIHQVLLSISPEIELLIYSLAE